MNALPHGTAGAKAAIRAATRALPLLGPERTLSFVALPEGQDPDGDGALAAAEGRFVHVYVDNSRGAGDRPATPMPDVVRAAVVPLLRPQG